MLQDARSIPAFDARKSGKAWPTGRRLPMASQHRAPAGSVPARRGWRLHSCILAVSCVAVGALGGWIIGGSMTSRAAHQKGACAALHMAAAYGYLDERQQRVVMRALATAINPDVDFFPGGYRALRDACRANDGHS